MNGVVLGGFGRGVGDLLGVVLALSARTRRMVQEPVRIDLDVFAPGVGIVTTSRNGTTSYASVSGTTSGPP